VRALPWLPQTSQATLFRHADPKRGPGWIFLVLVLVRGLFGAGRDGASGLLVEREAAIQEGEIGSGLLMNDVGNFEQS
jgi:hypothetical protein